MNIKEIKQKNVNSMSEEEIEFLVDHLLSIEKEDAMDYLLDVIDYQLPVDEFTSSLRTDLENAKTDEEVNDINKRLSEQDLKDIKIPEYDKKTKDFLADKRLEKIISLLYNMNEEDTLRIP